MLSPISRFTGIAIAVAILSTSGCTSFQGQNANTKHSAHQPSDSSAVSAAPTHSKRSGDMGMMGEHMKAMCPMHGMMMNNPEAHRAMMRQHMQSMSPAERQKMMGMMQHHMKMMQEEMQKIN